MSRSLAKFISHDQSEGAGIRSRKPVPATALPQFCLATKPRRERIVAVRTTAQNLEFDFCPRERGEFCFYLPLAEQWRDFGYAMRDLQNGFG